MLNVRGRHPQEATSCPLCTHVDQLVVLANCLENGFQGNRTLLDQSKMLVLF